MSKINGVARSEFPFLGPLSTNMLLIGVNIAHRHQVEGSLVGLGLVSSWEPGDRLMLPSADGTGTLFLHEVGSLSHDDQVRLLGWLDRAEGRTRVVSTSTTSLFARVEAGLFIEKLYYRLNTVSINVSRASEAFGSSNGMAWGRATNESQ